MDAHQIERQRRALVDRYGPWTASNIHLGGEVYTIGRDPRVFGPAADRITLAGIKGNAYRGAVGPAADIALYWPEKQSAQLQYYAYRAAHGIAMRLPYPITRMLRRLFGR